MVKAPAREPGDFCMARIAEPARFKPEKTKRTSTPKRFLHMGSFALLPLHSGAVRLWSLLSASERPTNLNLPPKCLAFTRQKTLSLEPFVLSFLPK